jgi:GT2 family glycosyltransferase
VNVDVIIVNYRSGDMLLRCLEALRNQTGAHHVHIVDNASDDGSPRKIVDAFPQVSMLPLRRNTGFARAVNIAASRSSADIVITLNPDTVPSESFVDEITRPFQTDANIASVAGTLLFERRPDIIASAGINVHRNGVAIDALLGQPRAPDAQPVPVFGASAGAAAYVREAFLSVGGLAEPFFMYLEDVDLAWRLRLRGYESVWSPGATALHSYSASAGEGSDFKRRLLARNRVWTLIRCLPEEIWNRDKLRILGFDSLAFGHSVATLDWPALAGRSTGYLGMLPRLVERERIQRQTRVDIASVESWIKPAISPVRLRLLRQMTGRLAARPETSDARDA